MARIKNFWDLKNITSYSSHTIDQFDDNTIGIGGGYFKWIASNNTSITDIPGIRIKPTSTTDGYWLRDYQGALKVEWFGPRYSSSTLSSLGITQGVADARYGTGIVNVTTDTYDHAAINYAMKLLETVNYGALEFTPRIHYVNKAIQLPRYNTANTGSNISKFYINGNGATIKTTNTNVFNIFDRTPPNQSAALSGGYIEVRFVINNFFFSGSAPQGSGQTCIKLGPSYGSHIQDIEFQADVGIHLEFCLNARLENIQGNPTGYGIKVDFGESWGGNNSDSQSNHTTIQNCRMYSVSGCVACYWIRAASGVVLSTNIVEGTGTQYGVKYDTNQSSVVKDFKCIDTHVEVACSVAAVSVRANTGCYVVDGISSGVAQTLIEFDVPSGYPQITVANISYMESNCKFSNKNGGGIWKFIDCNLGNPPWYGGPSNVHPYANTAWVTTGGSFKPVCKYSPSHVPTGNYRCYVIDPVVLQLTDD